MNLLSFHTVRIPLLVHFYSIPNSFFFVLGSVFQRVPRPKSLTSLIPLPTSSYTPWTLEYLNLQLLIYCFFGCSQIGLPHPLLWVGTLESVLFGCILGFFILRSKILLFLLFLLHNHSCVETLVPVGDGMYPLIVDSVVHLVT